MSAGNSNGSASRQSTLMRELADNRSDQHRRERACEPPTARVSGDQQRQQAARSHGAAEDRERARL